MEAESKTHSLFSLLAGLMLYIILIIALLCAALLYAHVLFIVGALLAMFVGIMVVMATVYKSKAHVGLAGKILIK